MKRISLFCKLLGTLGSEKVRREIGEFIHFLEEQRFSTNYKIKTLSVGLVSLKKKQGTTTLLLNIALALAEKGHPTLIIDNSEDAMVGKVLRLFSKRKEDKTELLQIVSGSPDAPLLAFTESRWKMLSIPFVIRNFKNPEGLITKLRNAEDSVSQYLRKQFSGNTNWLLDNYTSQSTPQVQREVIEEMNRFIHQGKPFIDEKNLPQFQDIRLSPLAKQALHRKELSQTQAIRINRLVLEDAYREEIVKSPRVRKDWFHFILFDIAPLFSSAELSDLLPSLDLLTLVTALDGSTRESEIKKTAEKIQQIRRSNFSGKIAMLSNKSV